jgi:hypothetical protein
VASISVHPHQPLSVNFLFKQGVVPDGTFVQHTLPTTLEQTPFIPGPNVLLDVTPGDALALIISGKPGAEALVEFEQSGNVIAIQGWNGVLVVPENAPFDVEPVLITANPGTPAVPVPAGGK